MQRQQREAVVARILAGHLRLPVRVSGQRLLLAQPSREQRYLAQEVYEDALREAELDGLYTEPELIAFLLAEGLWDLERDGLLDCLPRELEDFKVRLYQATFKTQEREVLRKALEVNRQKTRELHEARHAYDYLSCQGYAALARQRYLVAMGLRYSPGGQPVFTEEIFWEEPSELLEEVLGHYSRSRLEESVLRELARTDPWRSVWSSRKAATGVFGMPACDLGEEQQQLVAFALLYDSIHEHPDCPAEEILEDDDLLDGWLILQRRERNKNKAQQAGAEQVTNPRIAGAQEIFLVADSSEGARKIYDLNDQVGRAISKSRFAYLKDKGEVPETDMPDTRREIQMHKARMTQGG